MSKVLTDAECLVEQVDVPKQATRYLLKYRRFPIEQSEI